MMEFLNNIWIAVSTPNEQLIKFFSIPLIILEIILIFYFIDAILNLNANRKNKIVFVVCASTTSIISALFLASPFNILFNYISLFAIIYFTLKTNLLKTIIATILPSITFIIVQTLLFNPLITLLNITSEQMLSVPIYKIPVSLLNYAVLFFIILLLRSRKLHINLLDDIDKHSKSLIIFNLMFGLIYIIIEIIITLKYLDLFPLTYTFANFVMLLLYFCISLYSMSKVVKLTATTRQLESAEEYNKTLRILHDNVRGFKHDFDNIVTTIGGYVNTDDMEGLKKYYVQLQQDCEKVNNLYILNPNSINNPRYI